nr:ribonuclease H-like domain-containing protein [Tanacetum cinerariifolium]
MRPFGCHVTILNTLDQLGKFDGKSDKGIFVGYSTISKAFRVYNTRTKKNKPMIAGGGPEWLFDIDALSESMNYAPVSAERPNVECSTKHVNIAGPNINTANANDNTGSLNINIVSPPVNIATPTYADYSSDPFMPDLEDTGIFDDAYDDRDMGTEADYNNLKTVILVRPILSTRVHKDHPKEQIIGKVHSAVQIRKMVKQDEAVLLTFINN